MSLLRPLLFSLLLISMQTQAANSLDKLSAQKRCETTWKTDYQNNNKHIGKMVCSCVASKVIQYQKDHAGDEDLDQKTNELLKNPSHYCVTEGLFANTISRANFFSINDNATIGDICNSSWVGVMRTFRTTDAEFDTKKICGCATPYLAQAVAQSDELSPAALRAQLEGLVKQCDPNHATDFTRIAFQGNPVENKGAFDLDIKKGADADARSIADYLKKRGMIKAIVDLMNQNIKIPYNIHVITTSTDIGPVYQSDDKTISMDYQLMGITFDLYDHYYPLRSAEDRLHYFNNVNRFLLYHELGHALIDAYHLPVLGQQEDAADAMAAIIALNYVNRGYHVLLDSADFFNLMEKTAQSGETAFWDEHALNKQRYYRLLCFAYGRNPLEVSAKIAQYYNHDLDDFIKERGDYCKDLYETTFKDWTGVLKPYFKDFPKQP